MSQHTTAMDRHLRRRVRGTMPVSLLTGLVAVFLLQSSCAEVYEIGPAVAGSDCIEGFESIANSLKPGDTLVLRGGRYEQSCRRVLDIRGTREQPIVIMAAEGEKPVLTRPLANRKTENNIEIINARHLSIRGLVFDGGSIGVRLLGQTEHFELSESVIRNTGTTAFTANSGDARELYLHHNTIHTTGLNPGKTEGEGIYLGCHDGSCRVTDSRVVYNTLSDLRGRGGGGNDGIEIKPGSGGNLIAFNRIIGRLKSGDYPCILAYGGADRANIIENNTLENCADGIQVVRDAIVRGNLVSASLRAGIVVRRHRTVGAPFNIAVVNNTVHNTHSGSAALHLALWQAADIVVHNNALFSSGHVAIRGTSLRRADFATNWVRGYLRGVPLGRGGIYVSRQAGVSEQGGSRIDLMPLELLDAGTNSRFVEGSRDLNGTQRPTGAAPDIGAFERN